MKKCLIFITLLLPFSLIAQSSLKNIRQKSWQTFAYRITANEAVQFIKWDSIPVDRFVDLIPDVVFQTDSLREDKLPIGNYIFISTIGNELNATLNCITDLIALSINNKQRLQIDVRTKNGHFVNNAKVFVDNREAFFSDQSKTWWVKYIKKGGGLLKVYSSGDTLLTQLDAKDDFSKTITEQRKYNFMHSRIYHFLTWIPAKYKLLINPNKRWNSYIGATGYIIFSQPKYKPLDTVKFKGYVIDKKWNQYKKAVLVYLNYRDKGKDKLQLIANIRPTPSGSYIGEFVLADSIPIDINCALIFKTPGKKEIIREMFKIEDYVLDEIGTYSFKTEKEIYYRDDTLRFFANAKDANGLPLMDGNATLLLTTKTINHFYRDSIYVADTIYKKEIKLLTEEDTKFAIPGNALPEADITINASLIFKNSNNELHEENTNVEYKYFTRELILTQQADSIKAVYIENGVETEKTGEVEMNYEPSVAIHFPCTIKIDPIAEDYTFFTKEENTKKNLVEIIEIKGNDRLYLTRISSGDTLGFVLSNPYKIPVYFTVFDGKKIIASGKQTTEQVTWKRVMENYRKMYKVRWQYIWAGKERYGEENVGLLYKLLDIKINTNSSVFPGQKEAIAIDVKDYKGNPAADVNLTAVSYNNQFKKDIRLPEPPYLAKYKRKQYLEFDGFESEESIMRAKKYLLGKNQSWIGKFHLDTMTYYKLLFPEDGHFDAVTLIHNFIPQLSVTAVNKGVPQEIYLLYINRELVYYNGVTDYMNYAFSVFPGYVQVGLRMKDKYIEIDSFYLQPNYKHDVSFDISNLPDHSTVAPASSSWTVSEMNLLEHSVWQMENNQENNNAFVWQDNRVVKLSANSNHLVGPFRQSSMQFYNPGKFDISFVFEPGYRYDLSKQIARLEKLPLFPIKNKKQLLPYHATTFMRLGDTIAAPPEIIYPVPKKEPFILLSKNDVLHNQNAFKNTGMGNLQLTSNKDSIIKYIILVAKDTSVHFIVLNGIYQKVMNLQPGRYSVLLVTKYFYTAAIENILIMADGTNCINISNGKYLADNCYVTQLMKSAAQSLIETKKELLPDKEAEKIYPASDNVIYTKEGGATISGNVVDNRGKNPIPFVSVNLKSFNSGVLSDGKGNFAIYNLKPGKYVLVFSAIGYDKMETSVNCSSNENKRLDIVLKVSSQSLNEVVVIGYGSMKKSDLTGSISTFNREELSFNLQGRVAGVNVISQSGTTGENTNIRIRGVSTFLGANFPLFVIDGIFYDKLPKGFNLDNAAEVNVLSDAAAISIYGSRASNGAVIITTKSKTFRKEFRDYAFWQPDLLTDKNGHVSFEANYPDNITGWKTYVVAMDKKRRVGKASLLTQSYKPVIAQLSVPHFLVEGDSSVAIGKSINYTTDKYSITTKFSINSFPTLIKQKQLLPKDANLEELFLTASKPDTINASYSLETTTGFKDGEERKIPVYKKGTEEAIGKFWILQSDTSFTFTTSPSSKELNLYAQNNALDMLLDELDNLRKYPYSCMEQTASKLTGLAMESKIREQLKQPFGNQPEMDKLLQKVQKAQLFDGGWAWWEKGKTNFQVTNYITNALLYFRDNPLVETNIRNAFLYLQNQLQVLNKNELLVALSTLSEGHHEMNYAKWINKISIDSLTQHYQWLLVKIMQQQKMNYKKELQKLVGKKVNSMLGGIHWGSENFSWYNNETASTIIAFNVLKNEVDFQDLIPGIIQYFLEKRRGGHWINTVESAGIINSILPTILDKQNDFTKPASLKISGDTNFVINSFPFKLRLNIGISRNIQISKSGGGLIYFTAYQNTFNDSPLPVQDKFIISTSFKKNDQEVFSINTGEKFFLNVQVDVLKDAEYVMIQVPIPASCTYVAKKNNDWKVYREFYKDRVALFAESLTKGIHQFEIELETRYKGSYNLNPAKAELMYYPTFFGRNEIKRVEVAK